MFVRPRVRQRTASRDELVRGAYVPDATNTGHLGLGTLTNTVTTNQTYSTAGQLIQNTHFDGARVSLSNANITFVNCLFRGDNSVNALVTCTNANVSNAQFIDCTFLPKFPRYETNGIGGHDFTLLRCDMSHTTDLISPNNSTAFTNQGAGFPIGVVVDQCYLHDLAWWTAATGGVVHPSDTETHNDIIQIVGGSGLTVRGNNMDARFARQYGHWMVSNPTGPEPYTTVTLGSLSDGGPFQGIPQRGITGGSLTSGNDGNGRYNWDDLAGLMLNSQQGTTSGIIFEDNFCRGGNYFINGGGNPNPGGGVVLGSFKRNTFYNDQGDYGSTLGGTNGHTIDCGGTWSGFVTAPTTGADGNYYVGGAAVTVRT